MNRILAKSTQFFIIALVLLGAPRPGNSYSDIMRGRTEDEAAVINTIMESDNELVTLTYLPDPSVGTDIRMSACERLSKIGTSYSLNALSLLANTQNEDYGLRGAASSALWNIRYREAVSQGGNPEDVLLSIINVYPAASIDKFVDFETVPVPFTPRADGGKWVVEGGVYKDVSTRYYYPLTVMNDIELQNGTIEFKFMVHKNMESMIIHFRENKDGNGYAVTFNPYNSATIKRCRLYLHPTERWGIKSGQCIGSGGSENFYMDTWHTFRIDLNDNAVVISIDGTPLIRATINLSRDGKIALGTYIPSYPGSVWFDDVRVCGSAAPVRDYSDPTKTVELIAWAMGLLGDMGSSRAEPLLRNMINYPSISPYSAYLKDIANEALKKIRFINSFSPGEDPMVIINSALTNQELCVRKWGIDALIKQNPPDLDERLNNIFLTAKARNDKEFTSYIAEAVDELVKKRKYLSVEIEYPQDGSTVKTPTVEIHGFALGTFFEETIGLNIGENTYTKTVTDENGNPASKSITIYRVANEPPVLEPIGDKQVMPGQTLTFTISAVDPDDAELLYFAFDMPEGASFDNQAHAFTWTPAPGDMGAHVVRFKIDDGNAVMDEEVVVIYVGYMLNISAENGAVTKTPDKQCYSQGETAQLSPIAGDGYCFTRWSGNVPEGDETKVPLIITMDSNKSITANFVLNNRPPVLEPIGNKSTNETQALTFTVSATDPDGDSLNYSADNVPSGAIFEDQTFNWTPGYDLQGEYQVTFRADDGNGGTSDETITITVNNVNRPPVLEPIGSKTVEAGKELRFTARAVDPDNNTLIFNAQNLPQGATFTQTGTLNTYEFRWIPSISQAGNHNVVLKASDGESEDFETITITVTNPPPPPALPASPSKLTATAASKSQINLSWQDNSNNESGFKIENRRALTFVQIAIVGPNVTTFKHTGLQPNTQHTYRIRAYNSGGNSAYSNTVSATTKKK